MKQPETFEKPVNQLTENEFHNELKYYRERYFLDPEGSNTKMFVEKSKDMLQKLLKMYTGRKLEIDVDVKNGGKIAKVRIRGDGNKKLVKENISKKCKGNEIPYLGNSMEDTIDCLEDFSKEEIRFNHMFMGQMHPHDSIPSFVAGIAGKFLNGNTLAEEVSRVTTYLEKKTVAWLANEFGYNPDSSWMSIAKSKDDPDPKSSGNITVGGTTANLAALLVARNKAFKSSRKKSNDGTLEKGLNGKEGVVLGSEYSHYSLGKLCSYVGLGSDNFKKVKTLNKKMMAKDDRKDSLRESIWRYAKEGKKVIAVVATAGTTETGNIDDLDGIANLIDEFEEEFKYRPHYHVDAAHGGGFALHSKYNPKKGGKLKGIEKADSITVDPHKMLYTHYSAGCVIFKNKEDHKLLKQHASYLFKPGEKNNLGQYRVEGSMGLEGTLQTWASLFAIGKRGYEIIQENTLKMTEHIVEKVKSEKNFELLNDPEMNIVAFRYNNPNLSPEDNDKINKKAQRIMYNRRIAYISNDKLLHKKNENDEGREIQVFRAIPMHPYTTKRDVDIAFEEVKIGVDRALKYYDVIDK
jgi:glutamate/tyrosine decarboxylase-like PLP-dependent enzyme